jgi:phosphopentomutase
MLQGGGVPVVGIGKISDIFSTQGIDESTYSDSNSHGIDLTLGYLERPGPIFIFTNLVDFDSKYGHRNDPKGYAGAVEAFDARLPDVIEALDGGVLVITGDHGCDPTSPSTDHTRERTPLLAAGLPGEHVDLGTRSCFGDLGQTVCELLGVSAESLIGTSFAGGLGYGQV